MPAPPLDDAIVTRLYVRAKGHTWHLPQEVFAEALAASLHRAASDQAESAGDLERRLCALHLEDLALACACALGHDAAWDHFIREQRPQLYRAADALDPSGGARDLADSLYGELYGLPNREGERRSLFRYFHGRSSLSTWLRAVLAQRHVDRIRSAKRLEPLPDDDTAQAAPDRADASDPERPRFMGLLRQALSAAVARLDPRDRLRLGCYYAHSLTLAETGRLLGEHEATVSRNLARTRKTIRANVEDRLRTESGLNDAQIARCFEVATDDARLLDLADVLPEQADARAVGLGRSKSERKTS